MLSPKVGAFTTVAIGGMLPTIFAALRAPAIRCVLATKVAALWAPTTGHVPSPKFVAHTSSLILAGRDASRISDSYFAARNNSATAINILSPEKPRTAEEIQLPAATMAAKPVPTPITT